MRVRKVQKCGCLPVDFTALACAQDTKDWLQQAEKRGCLPVDFTAFACAQGTKDWLQQAKSHGCLPVDFTALACAQGTKDWVLVCRQNSAQAGLKLAGIEGGQKAQGPHAEANDWGQGGVLHKE